MKFLPYIWKHLRRTWIRTGSTVLSMGRCVLLFCTPESALARFNRVVDSRSPKRLVTRNAVSNFFLLPLSYAEQIDWSRLGLRDPSHPLAAADRGPPFSRDGRC